MLYHVTQEYIRGSKRNSVVIELIDATSGNQVTGKVASDLTVSVGRWRQGLQIPTVTDLATTGQVWTAGGVKELSPVRLPGLYRLDIPDENFVNDGISDVLLVAVLCAGCRPNYLLLPLVDVDKSGTTRSR